MTAASVPSPCINVCSLDERDVCRGCWRTREEIARWIAMSAAEQWRVLRACDQRRAASPAAAMTTQASGKF